MPLTERDYDLLSLYIDDALTPPERRAIESRLSSDAEFRAELDALRRTVALVKSLPEMVAPRDLRLTAKMAGDVLAELKAAQPPIRRGKSPIQLLTTFAAAAASLVLVFAGALTLLRPGISNGPMTAGTSATVAVAEAVLVTETSTETPTLKLDEDGALDGFTLPPGTLMPYATAGFGGGAIDPMADTTMMQEAATGESELFSAAPAPVTAAGEEPPTASQEEQEAPGDANDSATFMNVPAPTATPAATLAAAGSVGRMEVTPTQDAEPANRTLSMPPSTSLATATGIPTEAALAEMSALPTMSPVPAAQQVIETVVAEAGDDRAAQDEAQDLEEATPITEPSSPILGFALVIAGIALGVVALILMVRTG